MNSNAVSANLGVQTGLISADFVVVDSSGFGKDDVCAICLDEFNNDAIAHVGGNKHPFHAYCIDYYINTQIGNPKCPCCKSFEFKEDTKGNRKVQQLANAHFGDMPGHDGNQIMIEVQMPDGNMMQFPMGFTLEQYLAWCEIQYPDGFGEGGITGDDDHINFDQLD